MVTWTDRALLVVGAHIAGFESAGRRFGLPWVAAVHWRQVYNRLIARKIRLTKLQKGVE